MNYHYPLSEEWNRTEIIDVVNFFNLIEQAYESGVKRKDLLLAYTRFKQIVPAKSEEKQYFSQFEKASSYVPFQVIKEARNSDKERIKVKQGRSKY